MNCQDIARIVDSGKFSTLTTSEMRDADSHAHSCRHCAPLWMAHSRLAVTPIPAMPAELSVRCLTKVAAHSQPPFRSASRGALLVIGGLVGLAAAASMVALEFFDSSSSPEQQAAVIPATVAVPKVTLPSVEAPVSTAASVPPTPVTEVTEPPYSLPLIPAPLQVDAEKKFQMDLATRKALELYPEITQGPEIEGHFVVSLALRADGTVLGNTLAIANSLDEVNIEMHKMKPLDGGQTFAGWSKGKRMEDGRTSRGEVTLAFSVVPATFDVSRANARVEEIVRRERGHLISPAGKGGLNTLTVLLSEGGTIQRENLEFIGSQELQSRDSKLDSEARAKVMASKLGVDIERIGLMGSMILQNSASDPADRRALIIDYAWARRPDELAPRYGQGSTRLVGSGIDPKAALVVVERMLPEAFLQTDRSESGRTNRPVIVFTTEGKVIAAGRFNMQSIEPFPQQIQKIAPAVEIFSNTSVSVRNAAGKSVEVHFVWETSPEQKLELEKIRKTAYDSQGLP